MRGSSGKIYVLHVDDEPQFSEMAAEFLERQNDRLAIEAATSANEGLDRLADEDIDCIVSDLDMPGQDGIQFLKAVREDYPDLPFILYTGKGSEQVASEAISAGVTDYLQKQSGTSQYDVLANRIENSVKTHRSQAELQDQNHAFDAFFDIVNNASLSFDERMTEVLDLGKEFLNLDIGIISRIEPPDYTVEHAVTPDGSIEQGDTLDFSDTFCSFVYESEDPVAFRSPIDGGVEDSPCYQDVGMQAYLGELLMVDGNRYGTLNFSSPSPRDHRFNDGERAFIRTVSEWVGKALGRKERERKYERVVKLLDHTEQIADVGGWEIDTETREVFWSDHLFEMLGVESDEEPPLEEALDVYVEEDRPIVANAVEEALAAAEPFDVEARFERQDGEIRSFRIRGEPSVEDGEVRALRGAVQDITDRRRRERVLRDMYEIISDRHQSFEDQVEALLELGRAELDTQYGTLSEIRDEEYRFEYVATDDERIQAGDVVPVSATICELAASTEQTVVLGNVARDAPQVTDRAIFTERGISCYIGAPVVVEDGVYGTFCFYGTDARAGQFSDWEQTLVELMSRWVSYELQRQQAHERLRDQNDQLEQFTSIVSHDLRNPLSVAEGNLQLAQEECANAHLDKVGKSHGRMNVLIENLLTLARTGNEVGDLEDVALEAFVERGWETVGTAQATLRTETDLRLRADRSRLKQLLENLIRNAIEHGGEGITLTIGDRPDGFYVEDDGSGIPEEARDEIFDVDYSTTDEGTGFGLSIVKQIVDAHGWEITVSEGSMGGARFEVTGVEFTAE